MSIPERLKRQQERRLSALQAMSLAASVWAATFFGSVFIAATTLMYAVAVAAGFAAVVGGLMLWRRHAHPPLIEQSPEEPEPEEPPTSDIYGWEVGTFLIAAVGVIVIVVIGTVVRFVLPLAVITAYAFASNDATWTSWLLAATCCLAVLACLEFGVERPLSRRWGLPQDPKARPREDYCPPRQSGV